MNNKVKKVAFLVSVLMLVSLVYPLVKAPTESNSVRSSNEIRFTVGADVSHPALGQDFIVWMEYRGGAYNLYKYSFTDKKEVQLNAVPLSSETVGPMVYQNHVYWVDHPVEGWVVSDYNLDHATLTKLATMSERVYSINVFENYVVMEAQNGIGTDVYLLDKNSGVKTPKNITNDDAYQTFPTMYNNLITWSEFPVVCHGASVATTNCTPSLSGNVVTYDITSGYKAVIKENLLNLSKVKIQNLTLSWSQVENDRQVVKVYYINTGTLVTVSPSDSDSYAPQLSADYVTYFTKRASGYDLISYQFNTGKHTTLSWTSAQKTEVTIGSSDRYIAWLDNRLGTKDIFYVDTKADGTELDQDHDGLSDADEIKAGSLAWNPDTDNDGLTDYQEVKVYGTYPTQYDSDGDGLTDGEEVNVWHTNPKKFVTNAGINDRDYVARGYDYVAAANTEMTSYGVARYASLSFEAQKAQELKSALDSKLGLKKWTAGGKQGWFKVVNAYIYGEYNVDQIASYLKGNRSAISGQVLAKYWHTKLQTAIK